MPTDSIHSYHPSSTPSGYYQKPSGASSGYYYHKPDSAILMVKPDTLTAAQQHRLQDMYETVDYLTANIIADGPMDLLGDDIVFNKIEYTEVDTWNHGLDPIPRKDNTTQNSLLVGLILAVLVINAFNASHFKRVVLGLGKSLLNIRKRENAFDEHTSAEARVLYILIVQLCLLLGVILYYALGVTSLQLYPFHVTYEQVPSPTPIVIGFMFCLWLFYYLMQLAVYMMMGYSFADPLMTRNWIQGFRASQCLLSLALIVPTFVIIFYPAMIVWMVILSAFLYFLARILFICKGFRIFYNKFPSILYFILYLCTLEIIPVILMYVAARISLSYGL